ncbi:integrator complex subunit 6 [Bombina bombina]|uniref:integrator complex subunit 6 n=1 Tax=Bombina bombina TaxID=8345 RepID=UPI00235A651A|nr:integrator complex subunit 6 [Bombina bombina]
MPILLFLLDTSASMNQRTYLGTTYLDIAKGAVETFMKLRSRDPASRGDRYMLVTLEEPPYGIKLRSIELWEMWIQVKSDILKGSLDYTALECRVLFVTLRSPKGLPDAAKPLGPQPWHSCRKLIYVRPNPKTGVPLGHWPIPESFWPDQNSPTLPPRTCHPIVKFSCTNSEPMVIDKLPFDKYELEPSPLTQYILERKSPHTCWPVFVTNSAKYSELGHPFGYLKASTTLTCVNLFVMPYNYPVLLPLLDDLFKIHKSKPSLKWRQQFENYLKAMPPYYIGPLKKALRAMSAPNLIPENMEYGLSYSVVSYLKKLSQQAKIESDRLIGSIGKKYPQETGIKVIGCSNAMSLAYRKEFKQLLQEITGEVPQRPFDLNIKEFAGFQIALLNKDLKPQTFRNAYDIPRTNLLDHLTRMRANMLKSTSRFLKGQDEDQVHSIPIFQMGNYQEYLKQIPSPLRELDSDQPRRLHTFGNPFKLDKKGMMIDEADEFVSGHQNKLKRPGDSNTQGIPKRRRCMSPLLRCRPQTPPVINNHIEGKGPPATTAQPPQDLPKSVAASKNPILSNNILESDAVENHFEDQLDTDVLTEMPEPLEVLSDSSLDLMETADDSDNNSYRLNDTSDEFSENSTDVESCFENSLPAFTANKTRGTQPFRSNEVNTELKTQIIKEIRKPGRKYEIIFALLKEVEGSLQTRLIFLQNVIKEAARFKKRMLIEQLEGFLEEIHRRSNEVNHLKSF